MEKSYRMNSCVAEEIAFAYKEAINVFENFQTKEVSSEEELFSLLSVFFFFSILFEVYKIGSV